MPGVNQLPARCKPVSLPGVNQLPAPGVCRCKSVICGRCKEVVYSRCAQLSAPGVKLKVSVPGATGGPPPEL